jgi:hypothetical protein
MSNQSAFPSKKMPATIFAPLDCNWRESRKRTQSRPEAAPAFVAQSKLPGARFLLAVMGKANSDKADLLVEKEEALIKKDEAIIDKNKTQQRAHEALGVSTKFIKELGKASAANPSFK